MAIIRHSTQDYNLTVVAFGSNGMIPKSDADGAIIDSGYCANTYATINNSGFITIGYFDGLHNSIILGVELTAGVSGALFSAVNATYNITLNNNRITFNAGSNSKEISYSPGYHTLGFLYFNDGTNEGLHIYYDGIVNNGSTPVLFTLSSFTREQIKIGQSSGSTGGVSGIRLSKVVTYEYESTSSISTISKHYYPVTAPLPSADTAAWYETHYSQGLATSLGISTASGKGAEYGISIADMVDITGGMYDNILAILADDGGANTDLGWSNAHPPYPTGAYTIRNRHFAFDLGGLLVADETEQASAGSGYLIRGRKPKWNIFHDAMKHGWTIDHVPGSTLYKLRYNLFKTLNNTDVLDIAWFEGYGNSKKEVHYPAVELGSTLGGGIQFTNGLPYPCTRLFLGLPDMENKDFNIYFADKAQSGKVRGKLGNLAPWNYTGQELSQPDDSEWFVAGWSAQVMIGGGDIPIISAVRLLTSAEIAAQGGSRFLSKDTPSTIKNKFQSDMEEAEGIINYNNARVLYHQLVQRNPQKIDTQEWASTLPNQSSVFKLVRPSGIGKTYETLSENDTIDVSELLPDRFPCDIHSRMKNGQYNIIDSQSSSIIGWYSDYTYRSMGIWNAQKRVPRLYFGLKRINSSSTDRIVAKLEMIWCSDVYSPTSAPIYPDDYQCELILSRTRDEMLTELDSSGYPIRYMADETSAKMGWRYVNYWEDGTQKSETNVYNSNVSHLEVGADEFFGSGRSIVPTDVYGEYQQPQSILTKITVYDPDNAPITSMFRGNNWNAYNQTPMFWTGSKAILSYRPSQDVTPSAGKCALWNIRCYIIQSGVYTPATSVDFFLSGLKLIITRIHYQEDTGNNKVLRQVTQYDTVSLTGSSTYNITLGGSVKHTLKMTSFVPISEIWVRPGTESMYEEPNFTQLYLDPEGTEGTNYAKGDTFILEFTN